MPDKEMDYLDKSGTEALRNFANHEAAACYRTALERHAETFGDTLTGEQRLRRAHWERQLGDACFRLGTLPECETHLVRSLELLNVKVTRKPWVIAGSFFQILVQFAHRLSWRERPIAKEDGQLDPCLEAARAFQRLSQLHYLQVDMPLGFNRAMHALNLAEHAGHSRVLARAYSGASLVVGMLGVFPAAELYARLAVQSARKTGHFPMLAYALAATNVYRAGVGQWQQGDAELAESSAICERLGDLRLLSEAVTVQAMHALLRADYANGRRLYERLSELAALTDNTLHKEWGLSGRAEATLRAGTLEDAERLTRQAMRLNEGQGHRTEDIRLNAFLALACWRQGRCEEALQHAATAVQAIAKCPYATVATLEGFSAVAEIYLRQCELDPAGRKWREAARQVCRDLKRYARVFPVWRSRAACWQGTLAWLEGNAGKARSLWAKSLTLARRYDLPLDEAIMLRESGKLDLASPESRERLQRAIEIFERLGARQDASITRAVIEM